MKFAPYVFFLLSLQFALGQNQEHVDFIHASASIEPIPLQQKIEGNVAYTFQLIHEVDSIFLDARNIEFSKVLLDGKKCTYRNTGEALTIYSSFKPGKRHVLKFDYEAHPKQTVYFLGWKDANALNDQIWTQGQGKYTSHWLPSLDDMTEKVEFDLRFTFNAKYSIISNGKLTKKEWLSETESYSWQFDMENPMSSYLVA